MRAKRSDSLLLTYYVVSHVNDYPDISIVVSNCHPARSISVTGCGKNFEIYLIRICK